MPHSAMSTKLTLKNLLIVTGCGNLELTIFRGWPLIYAKVSLKEQSSGLGTHYYKCCVTGNKRPGSFES